MSSLNRWTSKRAHTAKGWPQGSHVGADGSGGSSTLAPVRKRSFANIPGRTKVPPSNEQKPTNWQMWVLPHICGRPTRRLDQRPRHPPDKWPMASCRPRSAIRTNPPDHGATGSGNQRIHRRHRAGRYNRRGLERRTPKVITDSSARKRCMWASGLKALVVKWRLVDQNLAHTIGTRCTTAPVRPLQSNVPRKAINAPTLRL